MPSIAIPTFLDVIGAVSKRLTATKQFYLFVLAQALGRRLSQKQM